MNAQGLRRARLPEQRLRRPGAGHGRGDPGVLQAHLRRDVPDVREARDQGGPRPVADLRLPRRNRQPAGLELQQVRRRQGRQGRRVLPEQGDARGGRAARGHRQGARRAVADARCSTRRRRAALGRDARAIVSFARFPCTPQPWPTSRLAPPTSSRSVSGPSAIAAATRSASPSATPLPPVDAVNDAGRGRRLGRQPARQRPGADRRHARRARPHRRASSSRPARATGSSCRWRPSTCSPTRCSRTAPSPPTIRDVRAYALQKTMSAMDLGAELGAEDLRASGAAARAPRPTPAAARTTRSSGCAKR